METAKLPRHGQIQIHTDKGVVRAQYVVLACNAYLNGLVKELDGMALPAGSYIIATEPLCDELARDLIPKDVAVCDQNVVLDYFRLSADNRMLFGGRGMPSAGWVKKRTLNHLTICYNTMPFKFRLIIYFRL